MNLNDLSDFVFLSKYARPNPTEQGGAESWPDAVQRVADMHLQATGLPIPPSVLQLWKSKVITGSQRSLQFGGDPILKSHPRMMNCFDVKQEFITDKGIKRFSDFEDGDEINVLTHKGHFMPAVVRSYGESELNHVTLRYGRAKTRHTVRVTSDHRWLLSTGEVTTRLAVGDKLLTSADTLDFDWDNAEPEEQLYFLYGLVYADGSTMQSGNKQYSSIRLCGHKSRYIERFESHGFKSSRPLSCKGDYIAYTGSYLKTTPDPEIDSPALIKAFVAGYLAGDGERDKNRSKVTGKLNYCSIQATGKAECDFIRKCFPIAGVYIVSETDLTGQQTQYTGKEGRPHTIRFRIIDDLGEREHGSFFTVESIEPAGSDQTWCLEVEEDQSFVLPFGCVTGNCTVSYADRVDFFGQAMWLLLSGCGVGFSVQKHHIEKLPPIRHTRGEYTHLIPDTIEGWAEAATALISAYTTASELPVFDYSAIRAKGSPISSGGVHPGIEQLRSTLEKVQQLLHDNVGKWRPIVAFDIVMHLADAVVSGGVRRSATICLFDIDDQEMITSKTGNWFVDNPQRGRANISAVITPNAPQAAFYDLFDSTKQFGEPGFIFVKSKEFIFNPCCEIAMCPTLIRDPKGEIVQHYTLEMLNNQEQFKDKGYTYETGWQACNLSTVNCGLVNSEEEFLNAVRAATILGTFQASYTKWDYLGQASVEILKRESLLGVSMTGIMSSPLIYDNPDLLQRAAQLSIEVNKRYATRLGIPQASRITCVKPEGTASIVLGTSAGIHPYHAKRYLRRVQGDMLEPLFQTIPSEALEANVWSQSSTACVAVFGCEAPPTAMVKSDLTALKHLDICKMVNESWVREGNALPARLEGAEHNVSVTITVQPDEWDEVCSYIWNNREYFSGISLLGGAGDYDYQQPPYQEVFAPDEIAADDPHKEAKLLAWELWNKVKDIEVDFYGSGYTPDFNPQAEGACQGGQCDLSFDMGDDPVKAE